MIKHIVIGAGPSGLIWAFYHPECFVLTDSIGGQFSSPFQLGPKYLHKTEYTEQFLKDIGVIDSVKTKTIKVGFDYDGLLHSKNTEENRKLYFEKTRGTDSEVYRSSMSEGKEEFDVFDIGTEELIYFIMQKVKDRVIINKVQSIDLVNAKIFAEKDVFSFDDIIITVPRPVFCRMIGRHDEADKFITYPTTFIKTKGLKIGEFDYVYYSDKNIPYHRISKIPNNEFCIEYRGDEILKQQSEYDRFILKVGQLVERKDTITYPFFINFFGRYACWKHGIKLNDSIKQILTNEKIF